MFVPSLDNLGQLLPVFVRTEPVFCIASPVRRHHLAGDRARTSKASNTSASLEPPGVCPAVRPFVFSSLTTTSDVHRKDRA